MARLWYKLGVAILGVFCGAGVGCGGGIVPEYGPLVEYGMPHAEYKLDGTVVSAMDQSAIEGILVTLISQGSTPNGGDLSAVTDTQGKWTIDGMALPCHDCEAEADDVDGAQNGSYQSATVALNLSQTAAGSGWDNGTFEQHDVTIQLNQK
jgi:putative lipoprotein (rSAM/lipoprotein system)